MRIFWSLILASGLLLVGLDVFESQSDPGARTSYSYAEDGSPLPPPPPPPPR